MTYFQEQCREETNKIVNNVKSNLYRCLNKRGQDFNQFAEWATQNGAKKATVNRLKMNFFQADLSEQISVLCLAAIFMNKTPEEVFFSELTKEQF